MTKTKNKTNATKSNRNRKLTYASITIIVLLIPTILFLQLYSSRPAEPKAALIDQLSSLSLADTSRYANRTFIETAENLLYERFSTVDYYADNATVDEYRQLASEGYKLIVWRAHSALDLNSSYVAISTSEVYPSKNYDQYLENEQLTLCEITSDPNLYFGITPEFIREAMSGKFEDTVIILMSCNGLKQGYTDTAKAFADKGAKAVISWDGWIDSSDNDQAISVLLGYLVNEDNTVSEAVHKIPQYSVQGPCNLSFYPSASADYRLPDFRQATANKSQFMSARVVGKPGPE